MCCLYGNDLKDSDTLTIREKNNNTKAVRQKASSKLTSLLSLHKDIGMTLSTDIFQTNLLSACHGDQIKTQIKGRGLPLRLRQL